MIIKYLNLSLSYFPREKQHPETIWCLEGVLTIRKRKGAEPEAQETSFSGFNFLQELSRQVSPFCEVPEFATILRCLEEMHLSGTKKITVRRGDYRNYYKGHMDKSKGEGKGGGGDGFSWGGVEGWGEKAHNCN